MSRQYAIKLENIAKDGDNAIKQDVSGLVISSK